MSQVANHVTLGHIVRIRANQQCPVLAMQDISAKVELNDLIHSKKNLSRPISSFVHVEDFVPTKDVRTETVAGHNAQPAFSMINMVVQPPKPVRRVQIFAKIQE